jgi:hypothetical protein
MYSGSPTIGLPQVVVGRVTLKITSSVESNDLIFRCLYSAQAGAQFRAESASVIASGSSGSGNCTSAQLIRAGWIGLHRLEWHPWFAICDTPNTFNQHRSVDPGGRKGTKPFLPMS